jgi:endonuclease G, mitochondrial
MYYFNFIFGHQLLIFKLDFSSFNFLTMISQWKVIEAVASRYGSREGAFTESAQKLALVREGKIPLISLEDDVERIRKRVDREGVPRHLALERINGIINFQDKNVLDKLSLMAQAVCRILKDGVAIGTGFLVAEDIIITNHHVIPDPGFAEDMLAEFDYELDSDNVPKASACFRLDARAFFLSSSLEVQEGDSDSGLDFTLIGLSRTGMKGEEITRYRPVLLDGNQGKIIKGESCVIIQHPAGQPKKIVLKDIAFFSETASSLVYESDTLPGSSGSMVVGLGTCEVVALHHSGLPATNEQNQVLTKSGELATSETPDEEIAWIGNEGIKISRIVQAVKNADLPDHMKSRRDALLNRTRAVEGLLNSSGTDKNIHTPLQVKVSVSTPLTSPIPMPTSDPSGSKATAHADFIISALNRGDVIDRIEAALASRYGKPVKLALLMPGTAREDNPELFELTVPLAGNVHEEAQGLTSIPEILNAEADIPLRLNADEPLGNSKEGPLPLGVETSFFGKDAKDEKKFLKIYSSSRYVAGKPPEQYRKWTWEATAFDSVLKNPNLKSPLTEGIRVVQFDTGYGDHPKVEEGFDFAKDYNFLEGTTDAKDTLDKGFMKHPGHGTRTGSLLIGKEHTTLPDNGNCGLLTATRLKLVPYRIAETVIIINRQKQLSSALDRAIMEGFDVITMSMGLPPTIATARMAKTAYDRGVIWCCAAGNEVGFVVAPAVYPGTIAVAASNPLDEDWAGSSRGESVDITAPGQDVYVPTYKKDHTPGAFTYGDGTSYATPHIAAAAIYWLAAYKNELREKGYTGWKRVEAFRKALRQSARTEHRLPEGFGAGILHAENLMKVSPADITVEEADYAYNGWNEHSFFASLQGYGELLKTYWNGLHGVASHVLFGAESMPAQSALLSPHAALLEKSLFGNPAFKATESAASGDRKELLERYMTLQKIVQTSAR